MWAGRPTKRTPPRLSTSPFAIPTEAVPPTFELGDRVHDDAHGLGRVTQVEDNAFAVTVDFGTTNRRFTSPFSKLTKL